MIRRFMEWCAELLTGALFFVLGLFGWAREEKDADIVREVEE